MYDLVVIGGGPGGLGVALHAAKVGAKVALIEKARLGGSCRNSACIPSKALLKSARVAHDARNASKFGVHVDRVSVDFPAVMARVRGIVASFNAADESYYRGKGIDVFFGSPAFEAYDAVLLDGRTRIEGHRFVIATGSRPKIPPIPGLVDSGFLTHETIWDLTDLPESLLILGAGPVGLEFAQAFVRLGSKVTVLDSNHQILGHEDPDAAAILRGRLEAEGIAFHMHVEVTGVAPKEGKTLVKFRSLAAGGSFEALRTHLLIATGRLANVEGLNLEAAGIHASAAAGIRVDDSLATENPRVFAIGDVIGRDQYTHAAEREAEIVFQNAVLKLSKKFRDDAMPRTIFTVPEFAAVGMTEAEARESDPEARVLTLDLATVDRVRVDGDPGGLLKVYSTSGGKVLGATMVGPQASLVLQEFVSAIEHGTSLGDLAATVHPFPTYSSAAWSIANQFVERKRGDGFLKTCWLPMRVYGFEKAAKV